MRFWMTRLAGTAGNQMLMVAVGWQMYELTGSAWDLGLVGLYQFAPVLLFTLAAGYVADRFDRAKIVAAALACQWLVAVVLALASHDFAGADATRHSRWLTRELLLGLSIVLGLARAFQMPAQQALIALLVPAPLLPRAMAFSASGMQAAVIAGPALGGLLFVAGASVVYVACARFFTVGIVLALRLKYGHMRAPYERPTISSLVAGVAFISQRKVLLGGATALLPMFAKDILHVGAWGLGLLRGAPAIGALLSSVLLTRWPLRTRVGPILMSAVAIFGLATVVFGVSENFSINFYIKTGKKKI